jgi:protein-export membrane protein SecD
MVSDPVETPFGYHLIRVDKAPYTTPDKATYDALIFTGSGAEAMANQKLDDMQQGRITRQEEAVRLRILFFSLKPTGWKDTALDGKHFRSASVSLDPTTNIPVVQIVFDEEGGKIFQELTKNNVGKRIAIFVGGELVSAPTVQGEIIGGTAVITGSSNAQEAQNLAQDLNTGAIPAPIYLSGQRTVEATLGAQALETSVLAGIIGMIIVMLYMFIVYRMLGLIANLALLIYAVIFLALLKLPLFLFTDQYVVLTLAGAAGLILSIGMAVDTNVLVFERIKEELKKGKMLKTAVEIGFEKAWSSIRDSNISTIITCVLLFMIGTSIVRGFAVTLGLGVVVSMFTGMIITRWICRKLADSKLAHKHTMYPGMKAPEA